MAELQELPLEPTETLAAELPIDDLPLEPAPEEIEIVDIPEEEPGITEMIQEVTEPIEPDIPLPKIASSDLPKPPPGAVPFLLPEPPSGAVRISPPEETEEELGISGRLVGRFMGTDVEDPLELQRLGAIIVGGVRGGTIGARTIPVAPGPLGIVVNPVTGALFGSAIGATVGAVFPEAVIEVGEDIGVLEEGSRERMGLGPEDLKTVAQGEALLELATGGGLSILRLTGRGTARLLTGAGTKRARDLAGRAAKEGIHLMPVQVGDRVIARGFVVVLGMARPDHIIGQRHRGGHWCLHVLPRTPDFPRKCRRLDADGGC